MQEGHKACKCTSPHYCKGCKKRHHTLLHQTCKDPISRALEIGATSTQSEETSSSRMESIQGSYCSFKEQHASQVLLATATIKVTDSRGVQQHCRVLLDGGSQSNYPLSYRVPVRERYGSTLLPATREQHDQNCKQSH